MKSKSTKRRIEALTQNQLYILKEQLRSLNNVEESVEKLESKAQLVAYIKGDVNKEEIQSHIKNHLPDYMIPSKFVILEEFPRLSNGKIDYKSLEIESVETNSKTKINPEINTELESKLLAIWQDILNINPLNINDNFFEIGGDSILSIQLISKARKEGILIEANQIFEHQTIAELAPHVKYTSSQINSDKFSHSGEINLSPIQHWFFEKYSDKPLSYDLVYSLELKNPVSSDLVASAVDMIVERYESLRLRFIKKDHDWYAEILKPEQIKAFDRYHIDSNTINKEDKLLQFAKSEVNSSDLVLFKAIHFTVDNSGDSTVMIMSNHLIVDDHSWNVIIDEFKMILDQITNKVEVTLSSMKLPYHKWIEKLTNSTNTNPINNEFPYWLDQISPTKIITSEVQEINPKELKSIETVSFSLDAERSTKLFNEANTPYNTTVDELLIFVLVKTLNDWTNLDTINIALTSQSRSKSDDLSGSLDTIGNIESYFPLNIQLNESDLANGIKKVKEQLRKIPEGGIGYSLLRYYNADEEIKKRLAFEPQVIFKHIETQQYSKESLNTDGLGLKTLSTNLISKFQIITYISEDKLHLNWKYSVGYFAKETIQELVTTFELNLKSVIKHCNKVEKIEYTPSDFPDSGLNEDDLNNLLGQFK